MVPLVFRMVLPAVVAQLVNLLYNLVDRIYIGHIYGIGTDALAGIGVTGSVIILVSAFASIVNGGAAPLASIALGRGDRALTGRYLGNGLALLRKIILLVPLALTLPRLMGVRGVFAAEAISDATAAICCTVLFLIMFPRILRKNCSRP